MKFVVAVAVAVCALAARPSAALTDFRVCNGTGRAASFAIAYNDAPAGHWVASGWWSVAPGKCKTPLGGKLKDRYYYMYAYSSAKTWAGKTPICVDPDKSFDFTFANGDARCSHAWRKFSPIDTASATSFTATLR